MAFILQYFWCLGQHLKDESRVLQPTATIWGHMAELYTFSSSTSLCCERSLRSSAERKIQWKRCRRDMNHEERQVDVDLLLVERSTLYSSQHSVSSTASDRCPCKEVFFVVTWGVCSCLGWCLVSLCRFLSWFYNLLCVIRILMMPTYTHAW